MTARKRAPRKAPATARRVEHRIALLEEENRRLKTVVGDLALDILFSPIWLDAHPPSSRKTNEALRPRR